MRYAIFPVIDPAATGANILRLRKERGLTVRDLQAYFGFEEPQAIYKWQSGKSLPSVDNLYALGALLGVSMEEILVSTRPISMNSKRQQDHPAAVLILPPAWRIRCASGQLDQLGIFRRSPAAKSGLPVKSFRCFLKSRDIS